MSAVAGAERPALTPPTMECTSSASASTAKHAVTTAPAHTLTSSEDVRTAWSAGSRRSRHARNKHHVPTIEMPATTTSQSGTASVIASGDATLTGNAAAGTAAVATRHRCALRLPSSVVAGGVGEAKRAAQGSGEEARRRVLQLCLSTLWFLRGPARGEPAQGSGSGVVADSIVKRIVGSQNLENLKLGKTMGYLPQK